MGAPKHVALACGPASGSIKYMQTACVKTHRQKTTNTLESDKMSKKERETTGIQKGMRVGSIAV